MKTNYTHARQKCFPAYDPVASAYLLWDDPLGRSAEVDGEHVVPARHGRVTLSAGGDV